MKIVHKHTEILAEKVTLECTVEEALYMAVAIGSISASEAQEAIAGDYGLTVKPEENSIKNIYDPLNSFLAGLFC